MCVLQKTCQPNLQTAPSEQHPYGTEWIYCKKTGGIIHIHHLQCLNRTILTNCIDEDLIVELYLQSKSCIEIAKELNCSTYLVRETLKKMKLYKPKVSLAQQLQEHKKEILDLYAKDKIRYEDVCEYVKNKYGIKMCCVSIGELIRKWKEEENERN